MVEIRPASCRGVMPISCPIEMEAIETFDQRLGGLLRSFFQAEDGIRDIGVTGVQTCALPILFASRRRHTRYWRDWSSDVCSSDLMVSAIATWGSHATAPSMIPCC